MWGGGKEGFHVGDEAGSGGDEVWGQGADEVEREDVGELNGFEEDGDAGDTHPRPTSGIRSQVRN